MPSSIVTWFLKSYHPPLLKPIYAKMQQKCTLEISSLQLRICCVLFLCFRWKDLTIVYSVKHKRLCSTSVLEILVANLYFGADLIFSADCEDQLGCLSKHPCRTDHCLTFCYTVWSVITANCILIVTKYCWILNSTLRVIQVYINALNLMLLFL